MSAALKEYILNYSAWCISHKFSSYCVEVMLTNDRGKLHISLSHDINVHVNILHPSVFSTSSQLFPFSLFSFPFFSFSILLAGFHSFFLLLSFLKTPADGVREGKKKKQSRLVVSQSRGKRKDFFFLSVCVFSHVREVLGCRPARRLSKKTHRTVKM